MSSFPRLKLSTLKGFPDTFSNGKILTSSFLEASNEVIGIIEKFGKLFTPVVSDMRGNVNNLNGLYQNDVEKGKYIEDLILHCGNDYSCLWILWLKRALQLIDRFFWHILNNKDVITKKSDSLQPMLVNAYDEVLKPYHGFLLRNTFALMNRFIPNSHTLLGNDEFFDENIEAIKVLMPKMNMHILKLDKFLKENGLDNTNKV